MEEQIRSTFNTSTSDGEEYGANFGHCIHLRHSTITRSSYPLFRNKMRSRSPSPPRSRRRSAPERIGILSPPPLPHINNISEDIELPLELLNEPYSVEDNGYRPEITVRRPNFLFEVQYNNVRAFIGGRDVARGDSSGLQLSKSRSNVSILNIFDTYGLDITYAFIRYVYYTKFYSRHYELLIVYLAGSYTAITGRIAPISPDRITNEEAEFMGLSLISIILLELIQLEQAKVKLPNQLIEGMSLPSEIVAKITGSKRIAGDVTKQVQTDICSYIPSPEEVPRLSGMPDVQYYQDRIRQAYTWVVADEEADIPYTYSLSTTDQNIFELDPDAVGSWDLLCH